MDANVKRALLEQARRDMMEFDAKSDAEEGWSPEPDYVDGGSGGASLSGGLHVGGREVLATLSDGTRLGNLEAKCHQLEAQHEVLSNWIKGIEDRQKQIMAHSKMNLTGVMMG